MASLVEEGKRTPGFSRRAFPSKTFAFQTDADVRRSETDQRSIARRSHRRHLVEPDCARLSLLVAAVADGTGLVGGQKPGVVQAFLGRVLPGRGDYRAVFHLGAAAIARNSLRTSDFPAAHDRADRQL